MRAIRMARSPIVEVGENMKKFGGHLSAILPASQVDPDEAGFSTTSCANIIPTIRNLRCHQPRRPALRNGLVFSNGDYWLQQRRLIQPGIHTKRLQGLYGIIIRTIEDALTSFPTGGTSTFIRDVRLSFDLALRSLIDIPLSADTMTRLSQVFIDVQSFSSTISAALLRLFYPINGRRKRSSESQQR